MNQEMVDYSLDSFRCHLCGYVAKNSSQLTVHHRVHTGKTSALLLACNIS